MIKTKLKAKSSKLKRIKFVFKKGVGNILFFKRHSNLFLVFLDSNKKHIVTLTSGFCKVGTTKKQKVSPLNMGILIQKLKTYMILYKVKSLILSLRQKLTYLFKKLGKLFKYHQINIIGYHYILRKSHGIMKGRNPRRV